MKMKRAAPKKRKNPQGAGRNRGNPDRRQARGVDYPTSFQPSPFTEESRKQRARQQRRSHFAGWPSKLLLVAAVTLSLVTLVAFLPHFYIEKILVTGSRMADEAGIRSLVDAKAGSHFAGELGGSFKQLLTLRYGSYESRIKEAYPIVRSVSVHFRFPSQLVVALEEKVEILAVRVSGRFALIDRNHEILRIADQVDFALPVLEGVTVLEEAAAGETLSVEDPSSLAAAAHLLAGLISHDSANPSGRQMMEEVAQIRQVSDALFYLFIPLPQGGDIRVKLEDNSLVQDKLSLLAYLLEREDLLPQTAGELDLVGETAYFRPDTGGDS